MLLVENVQKIFEDSRYDSLDYIVSRFILSHIFELKHYSLGDIARQLNLSKSSVASFFQNERLSGGYPAFISALDTEIGLRAISLGTHVQWTADFINKVPRRIHPVSDQETEMLAREILSGKKVLFIGAKRYREAFLSLINLLWTVGIPSRYIIAASVFRYKEEMTSLSDDDVTILLSPYDTLSQIRLKTFSFPQVSPVLNTGKGRRIYVCTGDDTHENSDQVIHITAPRNPYESSAAIDVFAGKLFLACVEAGKMDQNQIIYIA